MRKLKQTFFFFHFIVVVGNSFIVVQQHRHHHQYQQQQQHQQQKEKSLSLITLPSSRQQQQRQQQSNNILHWRRGKRQQPHRELYSSAKSSSRDGGNGNGNGNGGGSNSSSSSISSRSDKEKEIEEKKKEKEKKRKKFHMLHESIKDRFLSTNVVVNDTTATTTNGLLAPFALTRFRKVHEIIRLLRNDHIPTLLSISSGSLSHGKDEEHMINSIYSQNIQLIVDGGGTHNNDEDDQILLASSREELKNLINVILLTTQATKQANELMLSSFGINNNNNNNDDDGGVGRIDDDNSNTSFDIAIDPLLNAIRIRWETDLSRNIVNILRPESIISDYANSNTNTRNRSRNSRSTTRNSRTFPTKKGSKNNNTTNNVPKKRILQGVSELLLDHKTGKITQHKLLNVQFDGTILNAPSIGKQLSSIRQSYLQLFNNNLPQQLSTTIMNNAFIPKSIIEQLLPQLSPSNNSFIKQYLEERQKKQLTSFRNKKDTSTTATPSSRLFVAESLQYAFSNNNHVHKNKSNNNNNNNNNNNELSPIGVSNREVRSSITSNATSSSTIDTKYMMMTIESYNKKLLSSSNNTATTTTTTFDVPPIPGSYHFDQYIKVHMIVTKFIHTTIPILSGTQTTPTNSVINDFFRDNATLTSTDGDILLKGNSRISGFYTSLASYRKLRKTNNRRRISPSSSSSSSSSTWALQKVTILNPITNNNNELSILVDYITNTTIPIGLIPYPVSIKGTDKFILHNSCCEDTILQQQQGYYNKEEDDQQELQLEKINENDNDDNNNNREKDNDDDENENYDNYIMKEIEEQEIIIERVRQIKLSIDDGINNQLQNGNTIITKNIAKALATSGQFVTTATSNNDNGVDSVVMKILQSATLRSDNSGGSSGGGGGGINNNNTSAQNNNNSEKPRTTTATTTNHNYRYPPKLPDCAAMRVYNIMSQLYRDIPSSLITNIEDSSSNLSLLLSSSLSTSSILPPIHEHLTENIELRGYLGEPIVRGLDSYTRVLNTVLRSYRAALLTGSVLLDNNDNKNKETNNNNNNSSNCLQTNVGLSSKGNIEVSVTLKLRIFVTPAILKNIINNNDDDDDDNNNNNFAVDPASILFSGVGSSNGFPSSLLKNSKNNNNKGFPIKLFLLSEYSVDKQTGIIYQHKLLESRMNDQLTSTDFISRWITKYQQQQGSSNNNDSNKDTILLQSLNKAVGRWFESNIFS